MNEKRFLVEAQKVFEQCAKTKSPLPYFVSPEPEDEIFADTKWLKQLNPDRAEFYEKFEEYVLKVVFEGKCH
jgi:hypothetical protein